MHRFILTLFASLFLFIPQAFAGDFSGKWSGEIKKLSHPSAYGDMTAELFQNGDLLTGHGAVSWKDGGEMAFDVEAEVDQSLSMFFFHYEDGHTTEWGFGVLTDVDGKEAIAGSKFKKAGHHKPVETIDFTLFRVE